MSEPILYGPAYSTYARTVRLALEEKSVSYKLKEVDIFKGAHKEPEYLAKHPFGKVPAFEHDGLVLYETGAIVRYVDEAFEGPSLQPSDVRERARMTQVFGVVDTYAYPCMIGTIVIQRVITPMMGGTPDEAAIESVIPTAKTCVETLDGLMSDGRYMVGDGLSLADLLFVPIYDYFSQTPEGEELLAQAPNLARWWAGMSGRPSVRATKPSLG